MPGREGSRDLCLERLGKDSRLGTLRSPLVLRLSGQSLCLSFVYGGLYISTLMSDTLHNTFLLCGLLHPEVPRPRLKGRLRRVSLDLDLGSRGERSAHRTRPTHQVDLVPESLGSPS